MREMTITEQFMQMMTVQAQRDRFVEMNTSPLFTYEDDNTPVCAIRYTGITGTQNQFGLW